MVNFRLKEIVLSIASGITINHSSKGTYPVYGSTGIIGYTNSNDYSGERILIARVGANAGATNIVCGEYGVSDNTLVITVNSEYETKYIYYFLKHKKLNQFVFGSGQPLITGSLLKNISLYIPDRISQQHIAEALSDVDGMISSLEKLIAKYKSIKTACLQQMFPQNGETVPRMRLPEFTGAWEQRKYGEVVETRRGLTYKPSDICDSGIRVLRSSNIDEDTFVLKADDVFVKKDAVNIDYSKENDILITSANGSTRLVGKHAIISSILGNPAVHGGFMLLGTTKEPYFINASMGSSWYRRFIELYVAGGNGAIGNLNKNDLDNQVILIPSEPEQRAIGAFFKQLDHLITLHQRKLEKIQKIKQGMMQQLLTGKIRLL